MGSLGEMKTTDENDFLPDAFVFFEIMGWPKAFSVVKEGMATPGFVSDKTLRKLLDGEAVRASVHNNFLNMLNQNLIAQGRQTVNFGGSSQLSLKQQKWQGFLVGYSHSNSGKSHPVFKQTLYAYLNADIARTDRLNDDQFNALSKELKVSKSFPIKQVMTVLVLFAAYELDLQTRLGLDISSSYTLDTIPHRHTGGQVWPIKLLFDSWKEMFGFVRERHAFELRKVALTAKDQKKGNEFYSERTFDDWVKGLYSPDADQILSTETMEWISSFVDENADFGEEARIQWLRFIMACNFQRLLKKYKDFDSCLSLLNLYGDVLDRIILQNRQLS
jgi:hypothetical protein